MRLLKVPEPGPVHLPELIDFPPDRVPQYAILSHRWGAPTDEVLFADLAAKSEESQRQTIQAKSGFFKLMACCNQARKDRLKYVWVDTCCIDKSSSAELTEAINSMYAWYSNAVVCYAYLDDVPGGVNADRDPMFRKTLWVTRGWTLQELLAPSKVIFYSLDWSELGSKDTLSHVLSKMTGIDLEFLTNKKPLEEASVAKRMSWAAQRVTIRPEDIAYCLMGIFSVNMPMLYGEGDRAFLRLQEEIMKVSDDHSLFAWTDKWAWSSSFCGLLAKNPSHFKHSSEFLPFGDREMHQPYSMSNRGLRIELHLHRTQLHLRRIQLGPTDSDNIIYLGVLDCPVPPDFDDSTFMAIYLEKIPFTESQYARVRSNELVQVHGRGWPETIYVRQNPIAPDIDGVFSNNIIQLHEFRTHGSEHEILQILTSPNSVPPALFKSESLPSKWNPTGTIPTCKLGNKQSPGLACAIHVVWKDVDGDGQSFFVMLGSLAGGRDVGTCTVARETLNPSLVVSFANLCPLYDPRPIGGKTRLGGPLGRHWVQVLAKPRIAKASKYHLITLQMW